MTIHDYTLPPYSFFSPPGSVEISPTAMDLVHRFLDASRRAAPDKSWVAVFDWGDVRRVRDKADGQWSDFGPGIDLSAYEIGELPDGVVEVREGVKIALKIPGHRTRASSRKLIDVGATPATRVVLL